MKKLKNGKGSKKLVLVKSTVAILNSQMASQIYGGNNDPKTSKVSDTCTTQKTDD